ncbi:MAG TPA: ribosome maturation factor RimM [Aestuariivirgaceae bacterium]|jgi:16S rRNA processing protein RimM
MIGKRILVGQIGVPHGLKGEVKLISFTEAPKAVADYGPLETESGSRHLTISHLRFAGTSMIAKFEGISDRSAAEQLKGLHLYVKRDRLPALENGRYYHGDLIGLEVVSAEQSLGKVVQVLNFGAGDLLEVQAPGEDNTLLVPFAGARVDLGRETIKIELAEGFLDGGQNGS